VHAGDLICSFLAAVLGGLGSASGAPGSLVGDSRDFGLVDWELPMAIDTRPAGGSPVVNPAPALLGDASASRRWRRAALFLAIAAQLITISDLVAGIAGRLADTGLVFVPALAAGAVRLRCEPPPVGAGAGR
jgi:hypothetical protein